MDFLPILSRVKAKLIAPLPLLDIAAEVRQLEPASSVPAKPPLSLPDEIGRVRDFFGGREAQVPRLLAVTRDEGPTLSYRLPDALIADFTVYCGGRYEVYAGGGKRPVLTGASDEFDEAQLCTTSCAQSYFGHFLRESLPLEVLAEQRSVVGVTFAREPWLHESGYRALVGLDPVATSFARVRNLWITDERMLNEGWRARFRKVRERVRGKVIPTGDERVYLRRGTMGKARNLLNEDAICECLNTEGFKIIAPESMKPWEIASALANAKLVACVEGSVQQHAFIAMPEGATMLSIQPPNRFNSIAKLLTDAIDATFAFTVADPAENGFELQPDRFLRTLDLTRA